MPIYREQYDRMARWYNRFAATDQGRTHDGASDSYVDEIYAFFLNCYHLKDWIKEDPSVPGIARQAVEGHVNASRPLRLCADICNSLKHLERTSNRSKESPSFGKKDFALSFGPGQPTIISLKYEVETTAGPVDAFQLATDCVTAWDVFLTTHAL
jgi:hypothetical protein